MEPLNSRKSPAGNSSTGTTPPADLDANNGPNLSSNLFGASIIDDTIIGSPLKKHRASMNGFDSDTMQKRLGSAFNVKGDIVAAAEAAHSPLPEPAMKTEEEEL